MLRSILTSFLFFVFYSVGFGQYYSINLDTQTPSEQPVIDRMFAGNNNYVRAFIFEDGTPFDLDSWAMTFRYGWGRDDTNGMVTVDGTTSSNRVDFLGATNLYAQPYDNYYWSISGQSLAGYTKTFGTGTLKVYYDPATSTNLVAMMEQVNITWLTNFVSAQVESNRVRIAVFETNKVNLSAFNGTNVIFEGRIKTNEADIVILKLSTNANNTAITTEVARAKASELNISNVLYTAVTTEMARAQTAEQNVSNVYYTIYTNQNSTNTTIQNQITLNLTNQNATNILLLTQIQEQETSGWYAVSDTITTNAANGQTAFLWGNHADAGYLSTSTNIFNSLYIANRCETTTNLCDLTQGTYTGSLTSVSYTGYCNTVAGDVYLWGLEKQNNFGTSTISIGAFSLSVTAAGTVSNYFSPSSVVTQVVLKLDGDGSSKSDVSNVFIKKITSGNLHVAGDAYVTGLMGAKDFVMTYSGEQELTNGATITPHSNVKVDNTGGVITLGNPQIETNGINDGMVLVMRGATGTGGIQLTNGNGIALNCTQSFLINEYDVLNFVFIDGVWQELQRIDR